MRLILGLLASLTRATFPNGPSYGIDNGGCVKVPDSRWSSHVINQWRDANDLSGEKPQRSWHAEQMKVYLDTADEANEAATKYDELSITEDTYLELVFDTNIVNMGATFNPFYPIQLGNTFTKWDGSQTNQGIWYAEGCCTLHIELDDKEVGRDLLDGSISNDYIEWQWTNHPGTWFSFSDHLIEVWMCRHPPTTPNGYDTWFNGPLSIEDTHVGNAETSGCTPLDCSTDFRWITHWPGSGGCCTDNGGNYLTRTGQIAIDGDFGPLVEGDFFEVALDGAVFDMYEINGGNFVDIENIRDNAYRFFVNTNKYSGARMLEQDEDGNFIAPDLSKGGDHGCRSGSCGTSIYAQYQFSFISGDSFTKPQCQWIQLCKAGVPTTPAPTVKSTCSDPNLCNDGTCVPYTYATDGADYNDCDCDAGYQGEFCDSVCDLGNTGRIDLAIAVDVSGFQGVFNTIKDTLKDFVSQLDTLRDIKVFLLSYDGQSAYLHFDKMLMEFIDTHTLHQKIDEMAWSPLDGSHTKHTFGVQGTYMFFNMNDDIPDVLMVITDGDDSTDGDNSLNINTDIQFHVDTVVNTIGAKLITVYPGSGLEDTAMLNLLSQNNPDMLFHIDDLLTKGFDHICDAHICYKDNCGPEGTCITYVGVSDGAVKEDCDCNSGFQGQDCDQACELGNTGDIVDISIVVDVSSSGDAGVDAITEADVKQFLLDLVNEFDTRNNIRISLITYADTVTEMITPIQHMNPDDLQTSINNIVFETTTSTVFSAPAIQSAVDSMNYIDGIPDVMIIISNGYDDDQGSIWAAADRANRANIDRFVIGVPKVADSDITNLMIMVGNDGNKIVNGGTPDALSGATADTALAQAFSHICEAQPLCQGIAPGLQCEPNGDCTTFIDQDGYLNEDCFCDSGFQGEECDDACNLGDNDRVDVAFIMDVTGSNPDVVTVKDHIDQMGRRFDTQNGVKMSLYAFGSSHVSRIDPVQNFNSQIWDAAVWSTPLESGPAVLAPSLIAAHQGFDVTDDIPDIIIVLTTGVISDMTDVETAIDALTLDGVTIHTIGVPYGGVTSGADLTLIAQGYSDQVLNGDSSDALVGALSSTAKDFVFDAICNAVILTTQATTTPTTTSTTITTPAVVNELEDGTCYSGNWTKWHDMDNPGDGDDWELFSAAVTDGLVDCPAISAVQVRDLANPLATEALDDLIIEFNKGMRCNEADQDDLSCQDYEIRFCCEDCCPYLNISGNPELTDYYENYPGIYELQTNTFNDAITYHQITGYDELGEAIYGQGYVYYWADVGWLLGANTFTYSYYSDGIGERCPQFAPKNWTNEVFGTQLLVECLPVYPSCNDVECVENACCVMGPDGPVCTCEDGYTLYEDGSCLKESIDPTFEDGFCDEAGLNGPAMVWTDFMSIDSPDFGLGDYETLEKFAQNQICSNPAAIMAQRVAGSGGRFGGTTRATSLVVHISKELGFWCANDEQTGIPCDDFEVKFCCPKYEAGDTLPCDTGDGYAWTKWTSSDTPLDGAGDWETISYFGEKDICSAPIAVKAQHVSGSVGADDVTHIDAYKGFWCLNEEQSNGDTCHDFEVAFCCPKPVTDDTNTTYIMDGSCDLPGYGWGQYLNYDTPLTDDGDWETLGKIPRKFVCPNPTGIQARTIEMSGFDRVHIHKDAGFWCLNQEQADGQCADFEVQFCCPQFKTGECNDPLSTWTGWYNDEWGKKDEKIWVSNREEREELQMYGDGGACSAPTASEIRPRPTGSVSYQTTMWQYATNLIDHLSPEGYLCINEQQNNGFKCIDMEIRFCCEQTLIDGDCSADGYAWSDYYNTDTNVTDNGDFEMNGKNVGVCSDPRAVQARTVSGDVGDDFTHIDKAVGFYCINGEQDDGYCADYEVRYCCPKYQIGECNLKGHQWTAYYNRDTPADSGDIENLSGLQPNQACNSPIAIRARDELAGTFEGVANSDSVTHIDLSGFYCYNHEQPNGLPCSDFSVSYCCPTDTETVDCNDAGTCGENQWCLETATGPVCNCGDDDFNVDWDDLDFIELEDGSCVSTNPPENLDCTADSCEMVVGDCDTYGWEWTDLTSVSDPTVNGLGDFEYIHVHGGCSNPSGIKAQTDDISFSLPVHLNLEKGFWCLNSERFDPTAPDCADFSIQMCCPKFATNNCTEDGYEWSDYINNDGPDGIGDWESRSDTVCASPTGVEASPVSDPSGLISQNIHIDNDLGVYCLNDENDGACEDYAVRFCCPTNAEGTCSTYGYSFGDYLNSDDPEGQGDLELNSNHGSYLVCDAPEAIKAKQVNETELESDAFTRISVSEGFVCLNDAFNTCHDHEVTYCCPKWAAGNVHCNIKGFEWTNWLNEDNPTDNSGDWETRTSYGERKVCSNPIGVQASPVNENIGSTEITHIDSSIGFWCVNEEQPSGTGCADFEVRFCCPQFQIGESECSEPGYEWTGWLDRDDPTESGDYETIGDYSLEEACSNPLSIDARARTSGSTAVTQIDMAYGFWCNNDDQPNGENCADFEVRLCCPKKAEHTCDREGYKWTVWLDRDDPTGDSFGTGDTGDWENRDGFPVNIVCQTPIGIQAQVRSGSDGSTDVTHFDNEQGFWCINDEQPRDQPCADFEVRFCCPDDYFDPCQAQNITCGTNEHIVYDPTVGDETCGCFCDEGYTLDGDDKCVLDTSCDATLTTCSDFSTCINKNGFANILSNQNCLDDSCSVCTPGTDCTEDVDGPSAGGTGYEIECTDPNAYPALNGGNQGTIACVCDGKNPCSWSSSDFLGDITEDGLCITDKTCPVSMWADYHGHIDVSNERFLTDIDHIGTAFNTKQSDLYDDSMAEVLGRIKIDEFANMPSISTADWSNGHYLVIVWENDMRDALSVCPYGDYYEPVESNYNDGDVEVFETFVDPFTLRDSSVRDPSAGMDIVLNIRHDFNLDLEDISDLLQFRIAIVPKQWRDTYGDVNSATAGEVSNCLNQVLDNTGKLNGQLKKFIWSRTRGSISINGTEKDQTPKWKKKMERREETWSQRHHKKVGRN